MSGAMNMDPACIPHCKRQNTPPERGVFALTVMDAQGMVRYAASARVSR